MTNFLSTLKALLIKWHARWCLRKWDVPVRLVMAVSAHCSRHCWYCPQSGAPRPEKIVSPEMWNTFLFRLREFRWRGLVGLQLHNELGCVPNSEKYVRDVVNAGCWVVIFSNGDFPDHIEKWMQVHPWRVRVLITQHQPTNAQWEARLKPVQLRHPFRISVGRIDHDLLFNHAGLVKAVKNPLPFDCITHADISIDPDGNALLCCIDYNSVNQLGNIKDWTLAQIWQHGKDKRERLKLGIPAMKLCESCNFKGRK